MTDALELLAVARAVAADAAALVRERGASEVTVADTKSSRVDVVTQADRDAEALIRSRLAAVRPEDAVLGEEDGATDGASGVRWVVDPIDGTVNFLYGIPQYAVSIAAEVDGEVVAGVVRNPATDVEWSAARGHGAHRDGVRLQVRPAPPLAETLVLTGFGYDAHRRAVQGAAVARLLPRVRDIRRMGACALDLCTLAEGSADAYVEEGLNTWDYAAGGLIAAEAGARVEMHPGVDGATALVVAGPQGFDRFLSAIRAAGLVGE